MGQGLCHDNDARQTTHPRQEGDNTIVLLYNGFFVCHTVIALCVGQTGMSVISVSPNNLPNDFRYPNKPLKPQLYDAFQTLKCKKKDKKQLFLYSNE